MSRAKGDLTVLDPDGVALSSAVISFKEADGSTALAQALYAADVGGGSTTTHGASAKGELTRYTPLAQRAFYRINGDTVNWPIDFEVDPADVMALADDGVTMTAGYRALNRLRVAALETKIRDMGGLVQNVDAYAGASVPVNDGVGDPDAAINAAITALGGLPGVIQFGPGTYLEPTSAVVWPDNVIIRGAGMYATTIKHRASSSDIPINLFQKTDSGVMDLTVDGNYAQNTTYNGCEVSVDGTRCFAVNVKVINFNKIGIEAAGLDNSVRSCIVTGLAPASYTALPVSLGTTEVYQSLYGILVPNNVTSRRVWVTDCVVTGTRSAGIFVGGTGSAIIGNRVENCHRGDFPLNTQGGCIATVSTKTTVTGDTTSDHMIVADNYVGPSPTIPSGGGTGGSCGIEIDGTRHTLVSNNVVNDVRNIGITVNSGQFDTYDIVIQGGSIHGVDTAPGLPGAGGSVGLVINGSVGATSGVMVRGVSISSCTNAIWTENTVSGYAFEGLILESNTNGWTKSDTAVDYQSFGHVYSNTSHAKLPNRFYQADNSGAPSAEASWAATFYNSSATSGAGATGNGVWVRGGGSAIDYMLHITNRANNLVGLDIFGNGTAMQTANQASAFVSQMTNADLLGYGLSIQAGTNGSQYAIHAVNGAGTAVLLDLFASGQLDIGGPLNGQLVRIKSLTELTTIAAAAFTDTTILAPAAALILGVSVRVTTAIPTAATFDVGVAGATTRYCSGVTTTLNSNNAGCGTTNPTIYGSAVSIRITPNLTPGAATGVVRTTIHYLEIRAAQS